MTKAPTAAGFYSPDNLKHEESVGFLIKCVMQSILLHADRRLAEHGLTHAQWVPLFTLSKRDCGTVAELARDLQTDPGAMTRALDRLESKGLIARTRSTEDRRVVQLELTGDGRRLAALVPEVLCDVLNLHLSGFSRDEWQTLLGLLRRVLQNGEALRDPDKAVDKAAE